MAAPILPVLSVVLISYRRHDELLLCLEDLAAQRTTVPFEVVLILQAFPDDVPASIERRFGDRLRLRTFTFAAGLGVHGARNAALPHVAGEIVAFFDDDVRVPPHWVETLVPFYDDPRVGGVGGFVRHVGCARLSARLLRRPLGLASKRYRIDWGGFHTLPWSSHTETDQPADWLSGGNMSLRRTVLAQVGGFDEAYGRYGYDDVDIGLRARRAGWRLLTSCRLAVDHFPSPRNRLAMPDLMREEEARRVMLVRKAIGHLPAWRLRYLARLAWHVVGIGVLGISKRQPQLVLSVIAGARAGLAAYGGPRASSPAAPAQRA